MCQKDTWYELNEEGGCVNTVAHAIICAVVMLVSIACIIRGTIVLPYLVVRAKKVLITFLATQVFVFLVELLGLVFLVKESNSLFIVRFFFFSMFAFGVYSSSLLRTIFFLETVASTQQYTGRSLSINKAILTVCLSLHTVLVFIGLLILPLTLPDADQRQIAVQGIMFVGSALYFCALVPTALVGYRLLALLRTVIELGHPASVAIAKENREIVRQGMIKTLVGVGAAAVVCFLCGIFGLQWFLVHTIFIANQIGCVGATSYLKTCRIDRGRSSKNINSKEEKEKPGHHARTKSTTREGLNVKSAGKSLRNERQGTNSRIGEDLHRGSHNHDQDRQPSVSPEHGNDHLSTDHLSVATDHLSAGTEHLSVGSDLNLSRGTDPTDPNHAKRSLDQLHSSTEEEQAMALPGSRSNEDEQGMGIGIPRSNEDELPL